MRRNVVLPAPFGPTRPIRSPGSIVAETPSRTVVPPRLIETSCADMRGMGAFIHREWSLVERRSRRHDLEVEPDEEERRAERAWLETGSPAEFIRWRAFRERR